jgi:hypothetical protein
MSKPHRHRVEQSLTKARDELRLIELVQQMPAPHIAGLIRCHGITYKASACADSEFTRGALRLPRPRHAFDSSA